MVVQASHAGDWRRQEVADAPQIKCSKLRAGRHHLAALKVWITLLQSSHHLFVGDHFAVAPYVPVKGHPLYESHIDWRCPSELSKVYQFIIIHSPHDNNIHLHHTGAAIMIACEPPFLPPYPKGSLL